MILALNIRNIALIDNLQINFGEGLNILTGETGAGKSIVIDSMVLLLGGRANKDIIRNGTDKGFVEGIFYIDSNKKDIINIINEAGIDYENDDTLIISREITSSGRNYCRVNNRIVSLSFLNKLGSLLVDILGQHEHQFLLDNTKHIMLLDSFQDNEFYTIREQLRKLLDKYYSIERKLKDYYLDDNEKLSKIDLLKYQINEIKNANLRINEDKELTEKRNILINSEKLFTFMNETYNILYEGRENNNAVIDSINVIIKNIDLSMAIDKKLSDLKEYIENALFTLEDCAFQIRNYIENIDFSPESLDEIENRLDLISNLKRKYGITIEAILEFQKEKEIELEKLLNSEEEIKKINDEKNRLKNEIIKLSGIIHDKRTQIADYLEKNIKIILNELNMNNAIFKVDIKNLQEPNENGMDEVEFMISTNVGEPLKPLSKIASGGELSRIMLALKTILADFDGISTLIFDEVDTGISGRAAQAVAEKIAYISRNRQIICVSHLPQITSMADVHYKILKITKDSKTYINIQKLDYDGKIKELSRIISGTKVTELTLNHSKELIDMAQRFKKKIEINKKGT
ncbi:MAG: DNA repair protein RecN [Thermoanaerobacteraceae bacterium]|nr:DNA repair protein RecN [Thermoanaerobacteraceae bacterium]